jgi:hypothetical protein
MADFTPVASQVRPPQPIPLADLLNITRGAQAYKQAQEINPLEVQRAASELNRLQQLMPEEVRRAISEADRSKTEAGVSSSTSASRISQAASEAARSESEAQASEKTLQPRITTATAGAASAESAAEKSRLEVLAIKQKRIADSQISMINHPLIIAAEKNPSPAYTDQLINLVKQNGMAMARDLNIKPEDALKLLQPYLDIAKNDPGSLRGYFKQRHILGLDESARTAALSPSGVSITSGTESQVTSTNPFSETDVGKAIPGTYRKLELMPNEQLVEDNQGNQFIQSKDNKGKITIRRIDAPSAPAPAAPPAPAAAPAEAPAAAPPVVIPKFVSKLPTPTAVAKQINADPSLSAEDKARQIKRYKDGYPAALIDEQRANQSATVAPKKNAISEKLAKENPQAIDVPVHSQVVSPRFPVRVPNQPVFSLLQGEADAQKSGSEFLRNAVAQRNDVGAVRNNIEKIVKSTDSLLENTITKAGKGLQIEQYFNKLLDDSEYKILSKQLAQLQMSLANKQSMSTDAGKQMTAAATGSEVYPPQVLQKIAVQLHGEMEKTDRQGIAADKYARRFGESNMSSFGQMWNNNSDSKVFELMSLPKLIKDKEARGKMAEQIIGFPPGSEERKIIEQKYMNIQKLIKDGTL